MGSQGWALRKPNRKNMFSGEGRLNRSKILNKLSTEILHRIVTDIKELKMLKMWYKGYSIFLKGNVAEPTLNIKFVPKRLLSLVMLNQ
jgi:hypothetical protein